MGSKKTSKSVTAKKRPAAKKSASKPKAVAAGAKTAKNTASAKTGAAAKSRTVAASGVEKSARTKPTANERLSVASKPQTAKARTATSRGKLKQKTQAPKVRGGDVRAKPAKAAKAVEAPPKGRSPAAAPPSNGEPGVGDALPQFSLEDQLGATVRSDELLGKPYVLYFYPKDDTAGCTKEACDFNDDLGQFTSLGLNVYGVSPDSKSSHERFVAKYGLRFSLLCDVDKSLSTAMGVYRMKKNYGREYMGIVRSTFLIDAQGKIAQAWRGVRVAGHVPNVLEAARSL